MLDAELATAARRRERAAAPRQGLRLNRRLAQRIVDAHRVWLDEVEAEL